MADQEHDEQGRDDKPCVPSNDVHIIPPGEVTSIVAGAAAGLAIGLAVGIALGLKIARK